MKRPMTAMERKVFLLRLIQGVQAQVLEAAPRLPKDWGPDELRAYVVTKFKHCEKPKRAKGAA